MRSDFFWPSFLEVNCYCIGGDWQLASASVDLGLPCNQPVHCSVNYAVCFILLFFLQKKQTSNTIMMKEKGDRKWLEIIGNGK